MLSDPMSAHANAVCRSVLPEARSVPCLSASQRERMGDSTA